MLRTAIAPKAVRILSICPIASSTFSTTEPINNNEKPKTSYILNPFDPKSGPKRSPFAWLKGYILHTINGCKMSYRDGKNFFGRNYNKKTLAGNIDRNIAKGDLCKLIPFSAFIIVPFAELLIPVYLMFYQNAIPSRFLTAKGIHRSNYETAKLMLESQKKLRHLLPEYIDKLGSFSDEDLAGVKMIKTWLKEGFDPDTDADKLIELTPLIDNVIFPIIYKVPVLLREFTYCIGLRPLTGLYYFNSLLKIAAFGPITMSSPIIRTLFKFYPHMRVRSLFQKIINLDEFINKESLDGLTSEKLITLANERGIVPLMMTENNVKARLRQWVDLRNKKASIPTIILGNICANDIP